MSNELTIDKSPMRIAWEAYRDGWAKNGVDVANEEHAFLHGWMASKDARSEYPAEIEK